MESPEQRAERVRRLEQGRAERRAGTVWPTPDDAGTGVMPIEIAPGRGDLQYPSGFFPTFPTALAMVGARSVSFARLFQSQPWVAAAVMRMLTWAVRPPMKVYRRTGDDAAPVRLRKDDHPLAAALENPWLGGSQANLVQALLGPVMVHGNSTTEILSGANDTIQFDPKDWRFTQPIMPWRDSLQGFNFDVDNPELKRAVGLDEVLHVAWWSPIGPIGTSPLQQLGVTLQIEDAAQRVQRAIFMHGMNSPSAITTSDEFLGIESRKRDQILAQLRQDVTALYAGPENAGRPLLLPPGLNWVRAGQTTAEAVLIEQRVIAREEICGVYLISPMLLGIFDKTRPADMVTMREMTYTDCLGPPLVLIEQSITAQVCRDLLQEPDIFVEFDFGAVLRGDRLQEINVLRSGVGSALMTPNECRAVLNLPASGNPSMDEFYLPVNNLQPVGSPPQPGAPTPISPEQPPGPDSPQDTGGRRLHIRSHERDYEEVLA